MKELDGQIALVTGAAQGIGWQIALRLAREGAHVVLSDIDGARCREAARRMVGEQGLKATAVEADISSEDQVEAMIAESLKVSGRLDILVNNAGCPGPIENIEETPLSEWEQALAVNLTGVFLCCKHAAPVMKKQGGGCIVNIASVAGKRGMPQRASYAAAKMGIIGLTRTLAVELGGWKIRVNAVCPGTVPGNRQDIVNQALAKYTGKTLEQVEADKIQASPLKMVVDPKYVAGLVFFLCSADAAIMTGQDLNATAGTVMY